MLRPIEFFRHLPMYRERLVEELHSFVRFYVKKGRSFVFDRVFVWHIRIHLWSAHFPCRQCSQIHHISGSMRPGVAAEGRAAFDGRHYLGQLPGHPAEHGGT